MDFLHFKTANQPRVTRSKTVFVLGFTLLQIHMILWYYYSKFRKLKIAKGFPFITNNIRNLPKTFENKFLRSRLASFVQKTQNTKFQFSVKFDYNSTLSWLQRSMKISGSSHTHILRRSANSLQLESRFFGFFLFFCFAVIPQRIGVI